MNLKKNLYYTHRKGTITVKKLLEDKSLIFWNEKNPISTTEFLQFKSEEGISNELSIMFAYIFNAERKYAGQGSELLIKPNTQLVIPKDRASKSEIYPQLTIPKNQYKDSVFKSKVLSQLMKDRGYRLVHPQVHGVLGNSLIKKYPKLSVIIWSRVLGQSNNEEGWFDVTPFVENLSINVTKNGGNFSFSLPPISCEYKNGRFSLKKEHIRTYSKNNDEMNFVSQVNFFTEKKRENKSDVLGNVYVERPEFRERTKFLFHQIISPNDLVFIKFDTLHMESSERKIDSNFQTISSAQIPNKVYDLIGLVDKSAIKSDIGSKIKVQINISGRDLVKPLIENGIYFFPSEYANGGYKDLYLSDGSIAQLSVPYFRNIEQIMAFFLSNEKLNSIKVVPDNLLGSYNSDGKGIWKLVDMSVDRATLTRFIVDSSISTATGSMINQFKKICQEPFVEFYTDTYFDKFHLIVRVPPFTLQHLKNILSGTFTNEDGSIDYLETPYISVDEGTILSESLSFSDSDVYTWFQVMPKEVVGGISQDVWVSVFPPKIFPELVEIFGSKPMQIPSNYLAYTLDLENEKFEIAKSTQDQALQDLLFMIESYVHVPFTREGTITLIGDRRIKRGEYIYYAPTKELFYVDAVQHTYTSSSTIQNTTVVQVSRGMVIDYINGKNGISYFDIVNLKNVKQYTEIEEEVYKNKTVKKIVKEKVTRIAEIDHKPDLSEMKTNFPTKSGVNISDVHWRLLNYLDTLPANFKKYVLITAGRDGKHMYGSKHYSGNAIDLRLAEPEKFRNNPQDSDRDILYQFILNDPKRQSYGIEQPIHPNHGSAPHIHLEVYNSFIGGTDTKKIKVESTDYQYDYVEKEIKETITEKIKTGKKLKVLDVQKTLSAIKVNENVLDFFLKRMQFQ